MPSTSVLPAFCAAESDCIRRRFIRAGLPSSTRAAFARLRSEALSPRARSSAAWPSCLAFKTSAKARLRSAGQHHVLHFDRVDVDTDPGTFRLHSRQELGTD